MTQTKKRVRRSIRLEKDELRKFRKWVDSFQFREDAAEVLGVQRQTISRIYVFGSCKEETREKLIEKGII